RRQVDVAVVDRQLAVGGVTLDQAAETVVSSKVGRVRVVATCQDLAGACTRDAVRNLDLIVIDGESQVAPAFRQTRLQYQADRHVLRRFRREASISAASGDDFDAGGRLPVGRQAFTRAVGDAVRVDVRRAVVVAAVERVGLVAGGGANELL